MGAMAGLAPGSAHGCRPLVSLYKIFLYHVFNKSASNIAVLSGPLTEIPGPWAEQSLASKVSFGFTIRPK